MDSLLENMDRSDMKMKYTIIIFYYLPYRRGPSFWMTSLSAWGGVGFSFLMAAEAAGDGAVTSVVTVVAEVTKILRNNNFILLNTIFMYTHFLGRG